MQISIDDALAEQVEGLNHDVQILAQQLLTEWVQQQANHYANNQNTLETKLYPYVYVNEDGSARELNADEKQYLETPFHPADSGRPYIKSSYKAKDGWGSLKGFCARENLPKQLKVKPK